MVKKVLLSVLLLLSVFTFHYRYISVLPLTDRLSLCWIFYQSADEEKYVLQSKGIGLKFERRF
jgi:hypothetical protein